MSAATVLVVDDDEACRRGCRAALEAAHLQVATADSAEAALEQFRDNAALRQRCDLVLVDYVLPGRGGLSLFCELTARRPDLSGILLCGCASLNVAVEALNRGFSQVVSKPVDPVALVEAVEVALRERRSRLQNARLQALTHLCDALGGLSLVDDPIELCERIVALAVGETTADSASLMLLDPARGMLSLAAARGLSEDQVERAEVAFGEPIVGWVLERGVALELAPGKPVPAVIRAAMQRRGLQAGVVVPMVASNEPLGVLSVSWREGTEGFSPGDVETVGVLASDAGHLLKRLEHRRRFARDAKVATIGRLASSIIHDLRTPVTVIQGAAELLAELTPANRGPMGRIRDEAVTLDRMCEQLLSFTRHGAGDQAQTFAAGDLLAATSERIASLSPDLPVNVDEGSRPTMRGCVRDLATALAEVIAGAADGPVRLTAGRVGRRPVIRVDGVRIDVGGAAESPHGVADALGPSLGLMLLRHVAERSGGKLRGPEEPAARGLILELPPGSEAQKEEPIGGRTVGVPPS